LNAFDLKAWDFLKERKDKGLSCPEMAVINPGMIIGNFSLILLTLNI
jgi:hypothetical protein